MTLAQILAALKLAEGLIPGGNYLQLALDLFGAATAAYTAIKGDLSADDQAAVDAAVATSGAALDTARAQLDKDAAG